MAGDVVLMAHFNHRRGDNGVWSTVCRLHEGKCNADEAGRCIEHCERISSSRCSKRDIFYKALGRKIALERALMHLPRMTRKLLWLSYWAQTPVAKLPKAVPHAA
jgi:hypothetical protein